MRLQGAFVLSEGRLVDPVVLDPDADTPGSCWLERGILRFWQRHPKHGAAFHVTIEGVSTGQATDKPPGILAGTLRLTFHDDLAHKPEERTKVVDIALEELCRTSAGNPPLSRSLGEHATLLIGRVEGDELPVRIQSEALVFAPNQPIHFDVFPRFLAVEHERDMRLRVSLVRVSEPEDRGSGEGKTTRPFLGTAAQDTSQETALEREIPETFVNNPSHQIPLSLTLPSREGIYRLQVDLYGKAETGGLLAGYQRRRNVLAGHGVPLVILDPVAPPRTVVRTATEYDQHLLLPSDDGEVATDHWWRPLRRAQVLPRLGNRHALVPRFRATPDGAPRDMGIPGSVGASSVGTSGTVVSDDPKPAEPLFAVLPGLGAAAKTEGTSQESDADTGLATLDRSEEGLGCFSLLAPRTAADRPSSVVLEWPVAHPNRPHVLEIDYPGDVPQRLEIALSTSSAPSGSLGAAASTPSAATVPTVAMLREGAGGLTAVLDTRRETVSAAAKSVQTLRLPIWPRGNHLEIRLTNRSHDTVAAFGAVRLRRAVDHGPRLPFSGETPGYESKAERRFFLTLERPESLRDFLLLQPESPVTPHGATASGEHTETGNNLPETDIAGAAAYEQGGRRLVEYLHGLGYHGAVLPFLDAGTALYPSRLLEPTRRAFVVGRTRFSGNSQGSFQGDSQGEGGPQNPALSVSTRNPLPSWDTAEFLFRLFDREGLVLVPSLDFSAPLPALEERLRIDHRLLAEMRWIGPEGTPISPEPGGETPGRAVYYNLLHPGVQEAVLDVVRELTRRYAHHASFGGLRIRLDPHGYAALPDTTWGMDDRTFAAFVAETAVTGTAVTAPDLSQIAPARRFAARWEFIRNHCYNEWIAWRTRELARFYVRMHEEMLRCLPVGDIRGIASGSGVQGPRLYLDPAPLFDGMRAERLCAPPLPKRLTASSLLRMFGVDPLLFSDLHDKTPDNPPNTENVLPKPSASTAGQGPSVSTSRPILLKPHRVDFGEAFSQIATALELERSDMDAVFARVAAHPTVALRYGGQYGDSSYDADAYRDTNFRHKNHLSDAPATSEEGIREAETVAMPGAAGTGVFRTCAAVGSDAHNRRAFIRRLAEADVHEIFDSGEALPLGREKAIRDLVAALRPLPALPFETFVPPKTPSLRPVVLRSVSIPDGSYVYLLNDAPFPVQVEVILDGPRLRQQAHDDRSLEALAELTETRSFELVRDNGGVLRCRMFLDAYDFLAFRSNDPGLKILDVRTSVPSQMLAENGPLRERLDNIGRRIGATREGLPHPVLENPGFEAAPPETNALEAVEGTVVSNAATPNVTLSNNGLPDTASPSTATSGNDVFLPGWTCRADSVGRVSRDTRVFAVGKASLKIEQTAETGLTGIVGNSFDPGRTGRLFVSLRVGLLQGETGTPLRVMLLGKHRGQILNRSVAVGPLLAEAVKNPPEPVQGVCWYRVSFSFDRLPCDGLEECRLVLETDRPSTVWVDDIALYRLILAPREQNDLLSALFVARTELSQGNTAPVLNMLDGYWPRFLETHVPLPTPLQSAPTSPVYASQVRPQAQRTPPPTNPDGGKPENRKTTRAEMKRVEKSKDKSKEPAAEKPSGFFDRARQWFTR